MENYIHLLILLILPEGEFIFLSQDLLEAKKNAPIGTTVRLRGSGGYSSPYFHQTSVPKNCKPWGLTRKIFLDDHYLNSFFDFFQRRLWGFMGVHHNSQKTNIGLFVQCRDRFYFLGNRVDDKKCRFTTSMRFPFDFAPFEPK